MKIKGIFLTIVASGALLLSGCSNNAQTGAVIGSLVGAGLGKSTSNHRDKRAAIGAVLGGLVGASIGQDQDARNAAARGYTENTATTTPYNDGSSSHSHGNRSHTHAGATAQHSHNNGETSTYNAQQPQREVVYVERPYYPYPVRSSIIFSSGYNHYPRRHYRNRHHYRHNNRHYRHNNHHRNRHHNIRRY